MLAQLAAVQREVKAARSDPSRWPFREAAAVLSRFIPEELRSFDQHAEAGTVGWSDFMLDCEPVSGPGDGWWRLREGVRREALRRLETRERMRAALRTNSPRPDDAIQHVLELVIAGPIARASLLRMPAEELSAFVIVRDWLLGIIGDLPSEADLRKALVYGDLLAPMRRLAGDDRFVGRQRELEELREYVGVILSEAISRRAWRYVQKAYYGFAQRPPLLITGPGGVGKSALLARFILDHSEDLESPEALPFVYLDLDDTTIDPSTPRSLISAAALQLAVQWPAHEGELRRIAAQLARFDSTSLYEGQRSMAPRSMLLIDFGKILQEGSRGRPVLFVLDTFEEAQVLGFDVVGELALLLEELQRGAPMLRVVLAGRGDLRDQTSLLPTKSVPLGDLSIDEARDLVGRHVHPAQAVDLDLIEEVVQLVGRNPMSLKLASTVVREQGLESLRTVESRSRLLLRVKSATVQARLYGRILAHVHDTDVRKLAKPGLVLRRLTADVIREVLAGPCGLTREAAARAEDLLDRLADEVWLVERTADRSLRHRQDVRRVMLKDLTDDVPPENIRQIHDAAVTYYESRPGTVPRAEEIYHRLMRGDDPKSIEERWLPGVEEQLRTALDEVPSAARIWLSPRLGVTPDRALLKRAEVAEWEEITAQAAQRLLSVGDPKGALEALRKRSERSSASLLFRLESEALRLQGRHKQAREVAERGIAESGRAGATQINRDLLVQLALVEETGGLLEPAVAAVRGALDVPGDRLESIPALRLTITEVRLLRKLGEKRDRERKDAIERALRLLTPEAVDGLDQQPALLREIVAEIGIIRPELLHQALEVLGLETMTRAQQEHLAAAFARWDERLNVVEGRRGELAERAGLPVEAKVEDWRAYVMRSPLTELTNVIVKWRSELKPDRDFDKAVVELHRWWVDVSLGVSAVLSPSR